MGALKSAVSDCYWSAMDPISQMMIRIAYWLRHPPPRWQVLTMAAVVVLAGFLFAVEWFGWWPDMLTVEKSRIPITGS